MAEQIEIVISATDNASAPMRQVADAADDIHKRGGQALNGFHEIAVGALRAVGELAVTAALQAGQAMIAFGQQSVNAAGNFEEAVNGLAAVTGNSLAQAGFDLEDVSAKALQLGKDTEFSAQQAILAMTELAKGGVPVASVMSDATDATLALASAASVQLPTAAEIVAKQLGVWAETGVTAAQVTDLLASAANASTVDVEQLALGLANSGGTAKTAGVSFQDLVQTMALIAPNFASAADAGTSLKTMISRLIPTTDTQTDAMIALGLATEDGKSVFFDAQGAFIGMEETARLLADATRDLSQEEKLQAFNAIFGADAIRAAAAVANAGAEGFNAMGQAMLDSGGAATAAAVKQQGYAFAMEQFGGSVETAQIILGTMFLPTVTAVIEQGTGLLNTVLGWVETFGKLVPAIQASDDPIRTLLNAIGISIPGTMPAMQQLILLWQQWAPVVQSAVAQGVAAFNQFSAVVQSVLAVVVPAVQAGLAMMATFWQTNGAQIMGFLQSTWATIQTIITTALQIIWAIIEPMLANWTAGVNTHGTAIQAILTNVWEIIGALITGALALIQGVLQVALAVIQGDWDGAWAAIQSMSATFVQSLITIITAFGDTIAQLMGNTWDNIQQQVTAGWGFVVENTKKGAALVVEAVTTAFNKAAEMGRNFVQGIADGITGAISGLAEAAASAAHAAVEAAKNALNIHSPSQVTAEVIGQPFAEGIAQGITAGAASAVAAAAELARMAVGGAQAALGVGAPGSMGVPAAAPSGGALGGGDGGSSSATINGGLYVTTQPGQDNEKIAEAVIKKISDQMWGHR